VVPKTTEESKVYVRTLADDPDDPRPDDPGDPEGYYKAAGGESRRSSTLEKSSLSIGLHIEAEVIARRLACCCPEETVSCR